MDLDFYLSEMAVSDATGGGLTLLRTLGADVESIPLFVHVHPYGHLESAARLDSPAEALRTRCLDLPPMWMTTPPARRMLGRMLRGDLEAAWGGGGDCRAAARSIAAFAGLGVSAACGLVVCAGATAAHSAA